MSTNAVVLASAAGTGFFRNRLINGNFQIWQRGTSGTGATYLAADRWGSDQTNTTHTRSIDVPSTERFQYSLQISGSSGTVVAYQRIESLNCVDLPGNTVTISFWAKAASGTPSIVSDLRHAITGADNYTSFGYSGSNGFTLSTTWTKYTYTTTVNSTHGANGLALFFYNVSTQTFLITGVQLEVGSMATPFERRPHGMELSLCQRYYQKSYSQGVAPGSNTQDGRVYFLFGTTGDAINKGSVVFLNPTMRTTPTVTTYNDAGNSGVLENPAAASNFILNNDRMFQVFASSTSTREITGHWAASAEI